MKNLNTIILLLLWAASLTAAFLMSSTFPVWASLAALGFAAIMAGFWCNRVLYFLFGDCVFDREISSRIESVSEQDQPELDQQKLDQPELLVLPDEDDELSVESLDECDNEALAEIGGVTMHQSV